MNRQDEYFMLSLWTCNEYNRVTFKLCPNSHHIKSPFNIYMWVSYFGVYYYTCTTICIILIIIYLITCHYMY